MLDFLFTKTPLKFFVESLWRDEAFSVLLAKRSFIDIISLTAADFNPPLYYFLLKIWMGAFGSSEIAIRSLSLVLFMMTTYIVYLLLEKAVREKRRIFFYIFLFVLNPLLLYYAFEGRMYMLLVLFVSLSYYFRFTKNRRAHIASLVLGLYTHYFMIFVLGAQVLASYLGKNKKKFSIELIKIRTSLLFFAPWIVYFLIQDKSVNDGFWILPTTLKDMFIMPAILYTGYERGFIGYPFFLLLALTILILIIFLAIVSRLKKSSYEMRHHFTSFITLAFLPPLLILLISFKIPLFFPRYLIFSTWGLLMALFLAFDTMKKSFFWIFFAIIMIFTIQYNLVQLDQRTKGNFKKIVEEISPLLKSNDLIYVTNELDFHTAQYYFGENRVYIYGKSYQEIPQYVGKVLIKPSSIAPLLPVFPHKAYVIDASPKGYTIQTAF